MSSAKFLICFLLAVVTAGIYWPVHRAEFVNYDDVDYVVENTHVRGGLTLDSVKWAFTTDHVGNWHPLTWLSHMTDVQLFGMNAGAHHAVNLLFHIANALLLLLLLERMTHALWPSAMVAALFAWHPLHVESVAWVAERKDVLSTLFGLMALWAYAEYAESAKRNYWWAALVCFALGLMAKPMLVTLPFVFLLLDYWPLKRPLRIPAIKEKLPFFMLSAASSIVTFAVQRHGGAVAALETVSFRHRVLNAVIAYATYLRKTFLPTDLAVIYPISAPRWWEAAIAFTLLLTISIAAIYLARSHPWLLVGWLWFLGMLIPVIGLVQVGSQSMADRYTYLPLVGIFIIVVWTAADVASSIAVLAVLLVLTSMQVRVWHDSQALFEHAIAVTRDNHIAHSILGRVFVNSGRFEEAQSHFEETLRIVPNSAEARVNLSRTHYNFGNALMKQNQLEPAIAHFAEAARLDPQMAEAQNNWAYALTLQGRLREAAEHYAAALRINPDLVEARLNAARLEEQLRGGR